MVKSRLHWISAMCATGSRSTPALTLSVLCEKVNYHEVFRPHRMRSINAAITTGCPLHLVQFLPRDAMLALYMPWSCVSVSVSVCLCLSGTSRSSIKMAEHRNTQTTPHDSTGTLFFRDKNLFEIPRGSPPTESGAKCRWGRSKLANFDK